MKKYIEERAVEIATYIIENNATVRAAAKEFGISKSTVHKDLQNRLPRCNKQLYTQVRNVLDTNKKERHIRGGMATKRKFQRRYADASPKDHPHLERDIRSYPADIQYTRQKDLQ